MKKETIAIDIDDVLAAHIEAFVDYSNDHYGTDLTPATYTERWSVLWGVDEEEVERRAVEFHRFGINNFGVIEDAQTTLKKLKNDYHVVVVTARRKNVLAATYKWLDKHFEGIFEAVHFVPIWEANSTVTKADICKSIGADYLIDDLVRHCNKAVEAGVKVLFFERHHWKQEEKINPEVIKVRDWQEVLEYFSEKG